MSKHNGLIIRGSDLENLDKRYATFTQKFKLLYLIDDAPDNLAPIIDYLQDKDPNWNKYTIIQSNNLLRTDIEYVVDFNHLVTLDITTLTNHLYILLTLDVINSDIAWKQFHQVKHVLQTNDIPFSLALEVNDTKLDIEKLHFWLTETISFVSFPATFTASPDSIFKLFQEKSIPVPLLILENERSYENFLYLKNTCKPLSQYYLQPLQPLVEDLSLGIYKQFELDKVKYDQYQQAFELAISDLSALKLDKIKILIIGPGNGKLLIKLWELVKKSIDKFHIVAIEKNPICLPTLREKNVKLWDCKIEIIDHDIRDIKCADYNLIISELMGSFGDNELCPEILAQFDKPRPDLIMIPSSYTSYIQPVYTPFKIKTISLIKLSNYYALGEEQQLWEWEHPGDFQPNKIAKLSFPNKKGYKISGFLGWFTCTLYGHINIQIHSPLLSTYCKSWYPIYFPVHRTKVKPDHNIHLEFKRINNGENVWYEYTFHGKVYNENGVDYCMKLLDNQ